MTAAGQPGQANDFEDLSGNKNELQGKGLVCSTDLLPDRNPSE